MANIPDTFIQFEYVLKWQEANILIPKREWLRIWHYLRLFYLLLHRAMPKWVSCIDLLENGNPVLTNHEGSKSLELSHILYVQCQHAYRHTCFVFQGKYRCKMLRFLLNNLPATRINCNSKPYIRANYLIKSVHVVSSPHAIGKYEEHQHWLRRLLGSHILSHLSF